MRDYVLVLVLPLFTIQSWSEVRVNCFICHKLIWLSFCYIITIAAAVVVVITNAAAAAAAAVAFVL